MRKRMLLFFLASILLLSACKTAEQKEAEAQHKEEERLQAIAEMGEMNRQRAAERNRALESERFTSAKRYVEEALLEIAPEVEFTISLDASGYYDATEEELSRTVDSPETAREFFDDDSRLLIEGDWDKAVDEPDEILNGLMERGISGGLNWQFGGSEYTFDAASGKWEWHPAEGY
ncbi:MAG: hypothetical protein IJU50_00820 [Lachnospiraceae bacterium]|nr:hypothetical protein [Lachnospiraceae bacterium]